MVTFYAQLSIQDIFSQSAREIIEQNEEKIRGKTS